MSQQETTSHIASVEDVQSGDRKRAMTGRPAGIPDDVLMEEELAACFVPPHVVDGRVVMSLVDLPMRPKEAGIENLINFCTINEKKKNGKYYGRTVGEYKINGYPVRLEIELKVNGWLLGDPDKDQGLKARKDLIVPEGADEEETKRVLDTGD